jgi:hypothetical protein
MLAGLVWLVVDQRAGIVTQPYPGTPTPGISPALPGVAHIPVVGTPQSLGSLTANVQLLQRMTSANGLPARPGSVYQEIAVLVVNHGHRQVRIGAGQMSLRVGAHLLPCKAVPGLTWRPANPGVAAGSQVEGVVVASVPSNAQSSEVMFTLPHDLGTGSLAWRVP